jgi:3-oxoadipate enol-lactonase
VSAALLAQVITTERAGPQPSLCIDRAGEGPLVLFLHGIGGNRLNWTRQLRTLSDDFLAVAWDARGYGASEGYDGPLAMSDLSDDVIRVLDHVGQRKVHLVGLSLGGRIALDAWRRFPERVASLTLCDTSAGSKETQDPARIAAFLAKRREPLLNGETPATLASTLVEEIIGPNATTAARAELTASLAALHTDSYLKTLEMATRFTNFPDFATIDVPTLVVVGSEDRIAPPHVARAMAEAIPGAELTVIERAGHISNVEAPDAFNSVVGSFLRRVA